MVHKIHLSELNDYLEYQGNIRFKKVLKEIIKNLNKKKKMGTYREFAPSLDWGNEFSQCRVAVGKSLGALFSYCQDNQLPLIPSMVVRKDTRLPGDGFQRWYIEEYGSLKDIDIFVSTETKKAVKKFMSKEIVFEIDA